jgi:hypothetical protein
MDMLETIKIANNPNLVTQSFRVNWFEKTNHKDNLLASNHVQWGEQSKVIPLLSIHRHN